jgi:hypothetical protein
MQVSEEGELLREMSASTSEVDALNYKISLDDLKSRLSGDT